MPVAPPSASGGVQSVPHALEEHTPSLVGPLSIMTMGDNARLPPFANAEALVTMRLTEAGPSGTAIAAASSTGQIRMHVLTGAVQPTWDAAAPRCMTAGQDILAVHNQASTGCVFACWHAPDNLFF